jgi:hypothetical protein
MQLIPIALMAGSGAMQAVGAIQQAGNAAADMDAQARSNMDAARVVRGQASAREEIVRRDNARRLGEQRAAVAQSGFDPQSGSTLALQVESAREAELDALTEVYRGRLQSTSLENEAGALNARAKSVKKQGYLNAAGTLIGTAGKAYGMSSALPMPKTGWTSGYDLID